MDEVSGARQTMSFEEEEDDDEEKYKKRQPSRCC